MNLIQRFFTKSNQMPAAPLPADTLPVGIGLFAAAGANDTGVTVTETNAVTCSAVWDCVQIISQSVAALPAHVAQREDGEKTYDHPIARLLAHEPNVYMTASVFRQTLMANALLWGAGYAYIERDGRGVPVGLYPLRSSLTRPTRLNGQLAYQTLMGATAHTLTPDQVFYLPGAITFDGINALSPVRSGQQTIALALALEKFAAKVFGSAGNIGGILKLPPGMSDDAIAHFVKKWRETYTGPDNALKVAPMPEGYDFKPNAINPENGQMTQSRQHQVLEVARYYNVPPHMLGILDKASYASIEMQNMAFYQQTIAPWVVRFEQEANRKLLLETEKPQLEVKLNMDSMLRADTTARYAAHAQGIQAGFLTVNEARRKEGLPPVTGGDVLRVPLNMGPAAKDATPNAPAEPASRLAGPILEDAARRLLTKEAKALTRAAKKHAGQPEAFKQWAEAFYARHQALAARTLSVPLSAAASPVKPEDAARDYCAQALTDACGAFASGLIDDLADELDALRPHALAEQWQAQK